MDALDCLGCIHPRTYHGSFHFYAVTDVRTVCTVLLI